MTIRNKKGQFASFGQKVKKVFIVLILLSVMSTGGYFTLSQWLVKQFVYASTDIGYKAPVKDERSNKEKAINYLKQRGFTDEMLFQFTCLMYYENRGYDEYAFYPNKNLTVDRGFLMHNSKTAPYQISNECSFNMMCSLEKFADYILNGGSWNRWLGYKNYCK